jgi:hypothetical protein
MDGYMGSEGFSFLLLQFKDRAVFLYFLTVSISGELTYPGVSLQRSGEGCLSTEASLWRGVTAAGRAGGKVVKRK